LNDNVKFASAKLATPTPSSLAAVATAAGGSRRLFRPRDRARLRLKALALPRVLQCCRVGAREDAAAATADAVAKGAKVINERGCQEDRSLVFPTVLFPVTLDMIVAQEEQFGPVVPIVRFSAVAEVQRYLAATQFGQQAAIFTTQSADLPALIDFLAHQVTRININSQCQRGPDQLPFSGRKVSATGTLSVTDALRAMSIRVAVAANQNDANVKLVQAVLQTGDSNVLRAELLI
jgi:glyceraldehyde-3-phosphate dehydrogenase (NADP+)